MITIPSSFFLADNRSIIWTNVCVCVCLCVHKWFQPMRNIQIKINRKKYVFNIDHYNIYNIYYSHFPPFCALTCCYCCCCVCFTNFPYSLRCIHWTFFLLHVDYIINNVYKDDDDAKTISNWIGRCFEINVKSACTTSIYTLKMNVRDKLN